MKNPQGNYMKVPKGLVKDHKLSQGELYLYYILKEFEEQFYAKNNKDQFFVSDEELIQATGMSHNTMAKYKHLLKEKGLIRVRKRKDSRCDYVLLELYRK